MHSLRYKGALDFFLIIFVITGIVIRFHLGVYAEFVRIRGFRSCGGLVEFLLFLLFFFLFLRHFFLALFVVKVLLGQ